MAADKTGTKGLYSGLSSNTWFQRSENHVKFTEECMMCTEKDVLVKKSVHIF